MEFVLGVTLYKEHLENRKYLEDGNWDGEVSDTMPYEKYLR